MRINIINLHKLFGVISAMCANSVLPLPVRSTLALWRCAAEVIAPFWFLLFSVTDVGRVAATDYFKLLSFIAFSLENNRSS